MILLCSVALLEGLGAMREGTRQSLIRSEV